MGVGLSDLKSESKQKQIATYPNQKPWINKEVQLPLKACNTAFRSDEAEAYSKSKANLRRAIKTAKYCYKLKPSNSTITVKHVSFLKELNDFYACFDSDSKETATKITLSADHQPLKRQKNQLSSAILVNFYRCAIESILNSSSQSVKQNRTVKRNGFSLEFLGMILTISGWLGVMVACCLPMWRVAAYIGQNIVITQIVCTNCTSDTANKPRIMLAAGVTFIMCGLQLLVAVCWTANGIILDFHNPLLEETQKREFGNSLYFGWGASCLLILGGAILSCSCSSKVQNNSVPKRVDYSGVKSVSVNGFDRRYYV
ncbi:uncharacterized protein LOC132123263 [Carassius carassius]|uniref:uncharacterized protein LOC132123263 n=1 Tax=Carassius carassius TaxID=217509 RepID=UPI002868F46C|nr:uncharacterized protein LOC132123263 [Carassius carassius]